MGAATAARGAEFTDRPARAVRALNREDVVVVSDSTVAGRDTGRGWCGEGREEEKG
jgi:hypothetical protein